MNLVASSTYDLATLADLFTRGYENYVLPFAIDEPTMRFMVETFDFDLDASRVALRDGEPVGLCNLGLRGDRAWIGGVGVVTPARRQGVARALMEAVHAEARARGVREVRLEVIIENAGAAKLYEQLGYEDVREVEVWTLDADERVTVTLSGSAAEARAAIAALRDAPEPWQRADETVAHFDDVEGAVVDGAAALYRVSNGRVSLLQIQGDEAGCGELLRSLRTLGPLSILNVPVDTPAATAFRVLAEAPLVRQREMALLL